MRHLYSIEVHTDAGTKAYVTEACDERQARANVKDFLHLTGKKVRMGHILVAEHVPQIIKVMTTVPTNETQTVSVFVKAGAKP
jgi:hypothetical protein